MKKVDVIVCFLEILVGRVSNDGGGGGGGGGGGWWVGSQRRPPPPPGSSNLITFELENASLPVDARRSKTPLLKVPNKQAATNFSFSF